MSRFKIEFSYDGSLFYGFQTQSNKRCIESEINKVLTKINKRQTCIVASGRTDKGVHALKQVGHVDIDINIDEKGLKRVMNSYLPSDIHVNNVSLVNDEFHARYSCKSKVYKYYINVGEYNPIQRNYIFQYNYKLDILSMKKAIKYLEGVHDFRSFVSYSKDKINCVREITCANIDVNNNIIEITFEGNGFLRYQVRNMVGVLIWIGQNKMEPEGIPDILDLKSRDNFGKCAPASGLYLVDVKY